MSFLLALAVACGDDDDSAPAGDGDADADSDADSDADADADSDSDADADADGDADPEELDDPAPGEWPAFKRDLRHTGLADDMTGDITSGDVCVRWTHRVTGPSTRGAGGALIGQVEGVWTVFVAVDGWCADDETDCASGGPANPDTPGKVYALRGDTGDVLWSQRLDEPRAQADPYAPLLADVDADGARELIVPSTDQPYVFAFTTVDEGNGLGDLQWLHELPAGHRSESAPTAANLDPRDADLEIVLGDDADRAAEDDTARVFAISGFDGALDGEVAIENRSTRDPDGCAGGRKIDSSQAAVGAIGGERVAFVGGWNGSFYALGWQDGAFDVIWEHRLPDNSDGNPCAIPKTRSSAVVADLDGDGSDEIAFGWMYQEGLPGDPEPERERTATLQLLDADSGDPLRDAVVGDWKSSPAVADLRPLSAGHELVAGRVGGVYAADSDLDIFWERGPSGSAARGVRSSPALADIDDDGHLEVLIGIEGDGDATEIGLYAYDAAGGEVEWNVPLGEDGEFYVGASSSPAVGDVDGDGRLEVVVLGADGVVYAIDSDCPG